MSTRLPPPGVPDDDEPQQARGCLVGPLATLGPRRLGWVLAGLMLLGIFAYAAITGELW